MKFLLAFSPLISFLLAQRALGPRTALMVAAAVAIGQLLTNAFIRRVGVKLLDGGSALLFVALAVYVGLSGRAMSLASIRLCIDIGLFLIVSASLLIGRPFTLQYSPLKLADHPGLLRVHYAVSGAWAAAFAAMCAVDVVWITHPGLPAIAMLVTTALFSVAAFAFTRWYPRHLNII
jgi:hypothetical protein